MTDVHRSGVPKSYFFENIYSLLLSSQAKCFSSCVHWTITSIALPQAASLDKGTRPLKLDLITKLRMLHFPRFIAVLCQLQAVYFRICQ